MKKLIAWLLLSATLLCLTGLFASCTGGDGGAETTTATTQAQTTEEQTTEALTTEEETTTEATTEVTTEEETSTEITYRTDASGNILSNIPDDTDFGGETIKILTWREYCYWSFPRNAESTDVVESTLYLRNLDLAAGLNCTLDINNTIDGASSHPEWLTIARKSGDEGYDFFGAFSRWATVLGTEGLLADLNQYDYPDLDMPWYPSDMKDWIVYDKYFFVASNSCADTIGGEEVIYADQQAILENQLTDPLELVINYKWTLDMLYEYTSAFQGLCASKSTKDNPYYALIIDAPSKSNGLYYGAGNRSTKATTKNGVTLPAAAYTDKSAIERATLTVDKMLKVMDCDGCAILEEGKRALMQSRSCVFCCCTLRDILQTADDKPYIALPPPMLDEEQHAYYSCVVWAYTLFCVPKDADNPEHSAILIEAIACSDYNEIAPLFFDRKLKMRYSRSELGEQVYDIIRDALVLDFFRAQNESVTTGESFFQYCLEHGENSYATRVESANGKGQITRQISQLLATYKKNNG